MSSLLCVLVGIALTIGGLWLAARRALRPLSAASAYRNVAWRLGLDADTRGTSLRGLLDGRPVFVGTVTELHGHKRSTEHRAVIHLGLPLGLGLHIRPRRRRMTDRFRRRAHLQGLRTGNQELDALVEVAAADPDRARALLDDTVCEHLLQLFQRRPDSEVSDHWIHVQLRQPITRERTLTQVIEQLDRLARALETSRRAVPIAPELETVLPAWRDLSAELGLQLDPHLPELAGQWGGHPLTIRCSRVEDGYRADIRLTFTEHPPKGLRVYPQTAPDGFWNVGQDIQFGEPDFDAAFVIKGYDPRTIRQLCNAEARVALLALAGYGTLDVTDHRVELTHVPLSPSSLRRVVGHVDELARALGW